MKYSEILKKIECGEISIDCYGHRVNSPLDRFKRHYHDMIEGATGGKDGSWNCGVQKDQTMEEMNARMRDYYQKCLDWEYEPGEKIFDAPEAYCFHCGKNMKCVYDGEKVSLRCYFVSGIGKWGDFICDEKRCEYEVLEPMTERITTGGTLVFTNFFRTQDEPEDMQYTDEWSLNTIAGRKRIQEWKAKNQNIAYGQMGNMSYSVYINKERDSIIIGDAWYGDNAAENLSEEEVEKLTAEDWKRIGSIEGHRKIGEEIDCEVWRWEAGDKEKLGELYAELKNRQYKDIVEVQVIPGIWEFTHYYDMIREGVIKESPIFARMKLIKDKENETVAS